MRPFRMWSMRKLAIAAASFSAAIFAANYILPVKWLIVPAVIFALTGGALALLREKRPGCLLIVLFSLSLGFLNYYVQYEFTSAAAQEMDGRRVKLSARITSYPVEYAGCCKLEAVPTHGEIRRHKLIIYDNTKVSAGAIPGQIISLSGKITPADTMYGEKTDYYNAKDIYLKLSSDGAVSVTGKWDLRSVPIYLAHWFEQCIDEIFPDDTRAFMKSLMLGDKRELYDDEAVYLHLSRSGFMHIAAVSGMHIAFLVGFIQLLLGPGRRSSAICIVLIWLFTLITGASPSTLRASVMQTLLLTAPLVYRENDPVTSLSAALGLILLVNPLAAGSVSLQLSFGAMAGILLFAEPIYDHLVKAVPDRLRGTVSSYVLSTAASSLAVMVITVPLTAIHFGTVAIFSPLANLAALWSVSYCFCGGWVSCALSVVPVLGKWAAWLCSWLARYIFLIAGILSDIPFAVVYMQTKGAVLWLVFTYAAAVIFILFGKRLRFKVLMPLILSAFGLFIVLTASEHDYRYGAETVTAVDVGQGQSLALFAGNSTFVIDCGSGSGADAGMTAGEYLISCGRKKIDVLLLTHLHEDHANGVTMLMEMLPVDNIILPKTEPDGALFERISEAAKRHGTEIITVGQDCAFSVDAIRAELYAPAKSDEDNESCLMMKLSLGDTDVLVTGDSASPAEDRLLSDHDISGIEILVVGHHGSKYSSDNWFLRRLGAEQAIISVGYNTYGHPAEETLERLSANGYNVLRTDLNGTIEIRLD